MHGSQLLPHCISSSTLSCQSTCILSTRQTSFLYCPLACTYTYQTYILFFFFFFFCRLPSSFRLLTEFNSLLPGGQGHSAPRGCPHLSLPPFIFKARNGKPIFVELPYIILCLFLQKETSLFKALSN